MKSWLVLGPIALMFLASLTIVPSVTFQANPNFSSAVSELTYYNGSSYVVPAYACNQFGQPQSGVTGTLGINGPHGKVSDAGSTNASVYLTLSVKYPLISQNYTYYPYSPNATTVKIAVGGMYVAGLLGNVQPGQMSYSFNSGAGGDEGVISVGTVTDQNNPGKRDLFIFGSGFNGTVPNGFSIYYSLYNFSNKANISSASNPTESNMSFMGTMNSYHIILPVCSSAWRTGCLCQLRKRQGYRCS